jgi:hypothetical protein
MQSSRELFGGALQSFSVAGTGSPSCPQMATVKVAFKITTFDLIAFHHCNKFAKNNSNPFH